MAPDSRDNRGAGRRVRIIAKALLAGLIAGFLLGTLSFLLVASPTEEYVIFLCQVPASLGGAVIGALIGFVAVPTDRTVNGVNLFLVGLGVVWLGCYWIAGNADLALGGILEGTVSVLAGGWLVKVAFSMFIGARAGRT